MRNIPKFILLSIFLTAGAVTANPSERFIVNSTNESPLLDGRCGNDDWEPATSIQLPADVTIFLMHDKKYFYICVKGKAEDINVLDLYVESADIGQPHKYHLSAQMGENKLTENGWESTSAQGVRNGYAGLWVPYSGLKDPENRKNPTFERGTHRQVQIARDKFPGNTWHMMFTVSAIKHNDAWSEFTFPENGDPEDTLSWGTFTFTI